MCVYVCVCVSVSDTCPLLLRALHDADAAVELALGIVVDVGVPAAHVGRGVIGLAAGVVGAAVLEQDVRALLASCPPGVGQRRLAASVPALDLHAVLRREAREGGGGGRLEKQ